ncbi:MAG: CHASE2 domain-containing protein [Bdellovibrionaceae bacterium]|nr:CHASE2 domain-containing protein [Pseudobdellovibrionaceae bacterium]
MCWALGCSLLLGDEVKSFDLRFQMRGDQPTSHDVVVVKIHPDEVMANYRLRGRLSTWKDVVDVTDSFYWDPQAWGNMLEKLLAQHPRSIGVTVYLSETLRNAALSERGVRAFLDPRITWASPTPGGDRPILPLFADSTLSNVGIYDLVRDEDGIIRRFVKGPAGIPHLAEKVTGVNLPLDTTLMINYRGGTNVFTEYSMTEVLSGQIPAGAFHDKIILIGAETNSNSQFLTPMGPSHRAGVMAQIVDNILTDRWIKRAPVGFYMAGLFIVLLLSVVILIQYPQSVAFLFLIWLSTLITALSIWTFDSFSVWIPIFSPLVQILATWIIFLGYQANKIERKNMELLQESRYLAELEQLKNNFISLISHDLKTPIAKIQGSVDRMIAQHPGSEIAGDLAQLRGYSDELNRYIQSILKLLRVESRDFKLIRTLGDINETIENVIVQLRPIAENKKISLKTELEPLFTIEGDFTLLREVILNLVENAIKYTPEGGQVSVRSSERNDRVIVEVQDTGPGIGKDELQSVWQKFVRGKDQDLKTKGTGLGLYLVKYFIELHQGQVTVESELGRGTLFTVSLPLDLDTDKVDTLEEDADGSKDLSLNR